VSCGPSTTPAAPQRPGRERVVRHRPPARLHLPQLSYDLEGALWPSPTSSVHRSRPPRSGASSRCAANLVGSSSSTKTPAPAAAGLLGPVAGEITPSTTVSPLRIVHRRRSAPWPATGSVWRPSCEVPFRTVHPKTLTQLFDGKASAIALFPHGHSRMVPAPWWAKAARPATTGSPSCRRLPPGAGDQHVVPDLPQHRGSARPRRFPLLLAWPRGPHTTDYEWIYFGLDWGDGDPPPAWPSA